MVDAEDEVDASLQKLQINDQIAKTAADLHWSQPPMFGRQTSSIWDQDKFDPFQTFEVNHKNCHILTVHIDRGVNITKGWPSKLVDIPDPYIIISVPGTPNGKKKTKTIENCVNPKWDQLFLFYLDPNPKEPFKLELVLMDSNVTLNSNMGHYKLCLKDLQLDAEMNLEAEFQNGSRVFFSLSLTLNEKPDIRCSLALSEDEKSFLQKRRLIVMKAMTKLLGDEDRPRCPKEVPVLGLICSGGGFRSMIAMSGVCHALQEEGVWDCAMYLAGLSGSTWYLSHLYSHPDFPTKNLVDLNKDLREAVSKNLVSLSGLCRFSSEILLEKMIRGQPVSLADYFGHVLGEMLLGPERKNSTLSDQKRCLENGAAPLPLYTCVHVKKNVSARVFQDWLEFTPYEVGIAKYGTFISTEYFGSKFYVGKMIKKFDEPPLHFLQGIWGSAFSILPKTLLRDIDESDNQNDDITKSGRVKIKETIHEEQLVIQGQIIEDLQDDYSGHCESGSSEEEIEQSSDEESDISLHVESLLVASGHLNHHKKSSDDVTDKSSRKGGGSNIKGVKRSDKQLTTAPSRGKKAWKERRLAHRQAKQEKHHGFWRKLLELITTVPAMNTRKIRTGLVYNPLRGLDMTHTFPFMTYSPTTPDDETNFLGFYEPVETGAKKMYLADSGLTFNLPFPLLLRPQRAVDLYLSFECSERPSDDIRPFREILLAESWAKLNHVPFPPVSRLVEEYEKQPVREWYLFEDPTDQYCPVILHFHLCNVNFRTFKMPGIPRTSKEDINFADFDVFTAKKPFSSYKFHYTNEEFDRLNKLMEFNVKLGMDEIKKQIKNAVIRKRECLKSLELTQKFGHKFHNKGNKKFHKSVHMEEVVELVMQNCMHEAE